jgi:spore maturation protein CgeB
MNINILIPSTSSINTINNGANVQGDELVARSWVKYLQKDTRVSNVHINGLGTHYDVSISFSPLINQQMVGYKILYLQNVFPKPDWPGTVEVYRQIKNKYDSFIFPSEGLMNNCGEGLVCQFAVDPDLFFPKSINDNLSHNLCFVGNNIRDQKTSEKYLLCAKDKGLVIYGNPLGWNSPLCKGKISIDDEATLYSSSKICLNTHLAEHLNYGSYNFRIFNILACKGFIISDRSKFLETEFNNCMEFTDGDNDLLSKIDYYLNNPEETNKYREYGYDHVLSKHTFKHRMSDLLNWLGTKL